MPDTSQQLSMFPQSRQPRSRTCLMGTLLVIGGLLLGFFLAELEVVRVFRPVSRFEQNYASDLDQGSKGALGSGQAAVDTKCPPCSPSAIQFVDSLDARTAADASGCWSKSQLVQLLTRRGASSSNPDGAEHVASVSDSPTAGLPHTNKIEYEDEPSHAAATLVPYQLPLFVMGGGDAFFATVPAGGSLTVTGDTTALADLASRIIATGVDRVAISLEGDADEAAVGRVHEAVDQFLVSHPDWWVYAEPYDWLIEFENAKQSQSAPMSGRRKKRGSRQQQPRRWGLARTAADQPLGALTVQQLIGKKQFPSSYGHSVACSDQRLWLYKEDVGRYYGSLLGVVGTELALAFSNDCQLVLWLDKRWYQIDVPSMCGTDNDGPGPDPWECLFMPLSECRADQFYDMVPQPPGSVRAAGHAFRGPNGEQIPWREYAGLQASWVQGEKLPSELEPVDKQSPVFEGCEHSGQTGITLWWRTALAKFLSRPLFRTRSAVSRALVTDLDASASAVDPQFQLHGLAADDRHLCVALHVRHGDKLKELAQGVEDRITFNHTLEDYLTHAKGLLNAISKEHGGRPANTVLLMSDDPGVQADAARVNQQFAEGKRDIRILTLAGTGQPGELSPTMRNDQFLELLASMELLSHCQGVVGNFDSNISALLYQLIAWRHGRCPHYFSFSKFPWRQLGKKR